MRMFWTALLLLLGVSVHTNEHTVSTLRSEHKLFIITLDGFRWQEVFGGADPAVLSNADYNATSQVKAMYWSPSAEERRRRLMPFFWNTIASEGELYGNRQWNNRVNVANPYALSYPGYNELLTGTVDPFLYGNGKVPNPNLTVLDYLNATEAYKGKVAAFSSWDAFPYILNKPERSFYINSGYDVIVDQHLTATETLLNRMQQSIEDKKNTRPDELTFMACKEYVQKKKPSIVLLSFGGTDEAAHDKQYGRYLQEAARADSMISELWQYVQNDPDYAGKTTFLITTDHGRGNGPTNWYTHGLLTSGSSQTWMALLGSGIKAGGEQKRRMQLYQKDIKEIMLKILGR